MICAFARRLVPDIDRIQPLFPELRAYLLKVFDEAEPGSEYVISRYRGGACNLRTQLGRIIRKAGLEVWPKPWHNLRSTRQTELAERYPIHVVCQWIGNSRAVAQEHYLQVTDAHFVSAVQEQPAPVAGIQAAQNAAQSAAVSAGTEQDSTQSENEKRSALPSASDSSRYLHIEEVPATGFEPVTSGLGNQRSIQLSYAGGCVDQQYSRGSGRSSRRRRHDVDWVPFQFHPRAKESTSSNAGR